MTIQYPILSAASFTPTPASFPPKNVVHRMRLPNGLPVNMTPLNPITFLLRAAVIYGDSLAIAHPDVKHPVYYTYAVWCGSHRSVKPDMT